MWVGVFELGFIYGSTVHMPDAAPLGFTEGARSAFLGGGGTNTEGRPTMFLVSCNNNNNNSSSRYTICFAIMMLFENIVLSDVLEASWLLLNKHTNRSMQSVSGAMRTLKGVAMGGNLQTLLFKS